MELGTTSVPQAGQAVAPEVGAGSPGKVCNTSDSSSRNCSRTVFPMFPSVLLVAGSNRLGSSQAAGFCH